MTTLLIDNQMLMQIGLGHLELLQSLDRNAWWRSVDWWLGSHNCGRQEQVHKSNRKQQPKWAKISHLAYKCSSKSSEHAISE
jgi:hypothetical protein